MADCSYVRCMQERRYIKRELQRWYKNMVYIVGLERVAEELMGRRKWKVYQDSLEQSHVNATPSIAENGHCQGENFSQVEQESKQIDEEVNSKTEINNKIKEETNKLMTTETEEKLENNCENSNIVEDSKPLIEQDSKDIKVKTEKTEDDSEDKPPILKLEKPEPVDWKPQEKCYFCVDGKLLKVNELGQLVVESEPANPDTELNKNIIESEDSSESSDHENAKPQPQIPQNIPKSLEALLRGFGQGPNMTSLESVAAHIAVFGGMNQSAPGINPFYPAGLYQYLSQLSPSLGASAAVEPAAPSSPSLRTPNNDHQPPSNATSASSSAEQPLDLSSKSSTPGPASIDSKHIFKAKPRLQQIPGRRSYTEEELQNALQDIISGKLGTRRAAVLYGIPRSTLRNKVYKLALEQKREAALINNPPIAILEGEDDDKDSATEDDRDFNKSTPTPQSQTPQSQSENASRSQLEAYLEMVRGGPPQKTETKETKPAIPSPTMQNSAANPWIDPNAGLLSLLLAGGGLGGLGAALPALLNASPDELAGLPDILRKIIVQQQELIKNTSGEHMNLNGSSNAINSQLLMQSLVQQNKQQSRQTGTPETTSSVDDDVILKIPSYKPVVGSSAQNKNGDANITPSTSPQIQQSVLSNSPHKPNQGQLSIIPTALLRQRSESQSPPMPAKISISEIMANSITRNFQPDNQKSLSNSMSDHMDPYKRPTLTVKTFGGPGFGNNPNLLQMPAQHSPTNTGTGGKGTRPKRGKYRNYDRDSLVEAVKAVQRGEMSVHRAGSYYGVPHSTLEYKVKERHLMRPRKREPKPQPLDDRTGSTSSIKTGDMSVSPAGLRTMDKSKVLPNAKPPMKTPFPSTSPNGLKMPMFDPAMAAQLQYTSQLFWPNPGNFPGLPGLTDFSRSSNNSSFPPNAENFFTQQMLQKLQEDQARNSNAFKAPTNGSQSKSPRELAESIYDASNTNGSFLDGIIRHTLDKKTSDITQGALFEQLLKSNKTSQSSSNQSDDDDYSHHSNKRPGSPLNFTSSDIKRERASPSSVDTDPEYLQQEQKQLSKDAMESLAKLRENLSLHTSSEELNGGMSDENFPKTEISENNS